MYMFLKPANSDMENGVQKSSNMSSGKYHTHTAETEKRHFERYQNNTAMEWITLFKKEYTVFHFETFRLLFRGLLTCSLSCVPIFVHVLNNKD